MEQMQYQQVAVYNQPTDVGMVGRVSYNDQTHAGFVVPLARNRVTAPVMPMMPGPIPIAAPAALGPASIPVPAPVPVSTTAAASSPQRGFRGTPDNAKTKMCMRWSAGDCRFGDRCNFAHGERELRQLPRRDNVMQPQSAAAPLHAGNQFGMMGGPAPFMRVNSYPSPMHMSGQQGMYVPPQMYAANMGVALRAHSVDAATNGAAQFYPASQNSGSTTPPYSPSDNSTQPVPAGMTREQWIASGRPVPGNNGWWKYSTSEGEDYYHNYRSNVTQWDVPRDFAVPSGNEEGGSPTKKGPVSTPFQG
eukprot:TRINITY_DN1736_c0_g1_i1.p1 TRINITY_DN1736_c0_g1~~TRINITY_DN1736_c0_g1_i1.p1  ORF type:complete len:305 (+),score=38.64 TRINITY_DN1736_c0_g1_i1:278-1192(+)